MIAIGPTRKSSPSQTGAFVLPTPMSVTPSPLRRKNISRFLLGQFSDLFGQLRKIGVRECLAWPHDRQLLFERWYREERNRLRVALMSLVQVDHSLPSGLVS